MSDTRNFSFRQPPTYQHRLGRFKTGASTTVVNGAPVVGSGDADTTDKRLTVALAAAGAAPIPGLSGVANQENPWDRGAGYDMVLTKSVDFHACLSSEQVQVCHGSEVKVLVQNTEDVAAGEFQALEGITMFAGDLDTLNIGDPVTPGAGSDASGYWKKATGGDGVWGYIVELDADAGIVVFQLKF